MSHGALWHDLLSEFSEGDSAVFILIHFLNNLCSFLIANVEATGLDQASELLARDGSIIIHVERVECLIDVEVGHALEALALALSSDLSLEVGPPDGAELELSVWHEAVISSVERISVVRATALNHAGVVSIESEESIREFAHIETTIT